jgi:hypothetical protein
MVTLQGIRRELDNGWTARIALVALFWFVYKILDWSWAFASTALATKADLMGAAAVIAAVGAIPQALLTMAVNKYMEMRMQQPVLVEDRRQPEVVVPTVKGV